MVGSITNNNSERESLGQVKSCFDKVDIVCSFDPGDDVRDAIRD